MATITRSTKAGTGTTDFGPGTDILSSEVNEDLNTAYGLVNGQLDNVNIKATGANIKGTQIASAPDGISATNLNTDAVETAKIKDLNVTSAKLAAGAALANLAASSIGTDKLKVFIHNQAITIAGTASSVISASADDSGANWGATVYIVDGGTPTYGNTSGNPSGGSSPFPKATYDLIGLFLKNKGIVGPNVTATLVFIFMTKVS